MTTQLTYREFWLLKIVLFVALLFSCFTFSPYVNTAPAQRQKAPIELFDKQNHKGLHWTISYKNASSHINTDRNTNRPLQLYKKAINIYNRISQVKFDYLHKQFYTLKIASFLLIKTPQTSSEDVPLVIVA